MRERQRRTYTNLNVDEFIKECGRPLERQRNLKDISKKVHSLRRYVGDEFEPDKRDAQEMLEDFEWVLDIIAHMEMGLMDIYRLIFSPYSNHYLQTEDNTVTDSMDSIHQVLESIAPFERRNYW